MNRYALTRVALVIAITVSLIVGGSVGFFVGSLNVRAPTTVTMTVTPTVEAPKLPPLKLDVGHSTLFSVEYRDGYKLVRDALNRTLILVPRGGSPPTDVRGTVVYIPVERVILQSATQVALITLLAEYNPRVLDSVIAIMWGKQYTWYLPVIKERLESGRIRDVGSASSPDYEAIIAQRPELVMVYTFPGDPVVSKLEELKVPYAVNNEWREGTALGRFEWIKFIAAFYNMELEAHRIVERVISKIEDIKKNIERAPPVKVAWFNVWRGTVYAAAGDSYVGKALKELNARYVFEDLRGSPRVTLEDLALRTADVDVIIYSSIVNRIADIVSEAPVLANSKAVRNGRVYVFTETYFQLGYPYTDEWYADIAAILYPDLFPNRELKFFRRIS
ncbi:MAG: ABC transporter substrate-binding protein [Aigarchaeota archaeon]|nr:ABC transporter substrate-binding protein [Aigarchaeota archaeon]MDW8092944.1 ABC transporter substrate-binding protein [Nitrososphaerota archaeon]